MHGKMDCSGLTDPGRARPVNEDQFLIASLNRSMQVHSTSIDLDAQTRLFGPSQGQLLLVADGMGGHASGKRASALAVDSIAAYVLNTMPWFFRLREDSEESFADDLKAALAYCQERLNAEGERVPDRQGMGTTLTLAYLIWPRLFVVHAGNSRCYLLRGGRLKQITRDQTGGQRLAEAGATEGESSLWSRLLWNVVGGGSAELAPEVYRAEMALGDSLLLCTDGLTRQLPDAAVAKLLAEEVPSAETCRRLVGAANAAGGVDNVTAVVAHFRDAKQQRAVERAVESLAVEAVESAPAEEVVSVQADPTGEPVLS